MKIVALNLKRLIPAVRDQLFSVALLVRNKLVIIAKKGISRRVLDSFSRRWIAKITHKLRSSTEMYDLLQVIGWFPARK